MRHFCGPGMESKLRSRTTDKELARHAEAPHLRRLSVLLSRFRTFEALRYRDYRLLWYSQVFVSMGTLMDEVTRGWLIYELTNSAVQLGLVRGIQAVPFLILSPLAGGAADRYSRKAQLITAQVVNALVFAVTALLIFTGRIRPWHIYVTAFLMAVVQTFQQPARASMISDAVPPTVLTNAIGLNAVTYNVARSAGPALAGILISLLGTGGAYSVQAFFFILATIWTFQLRIARHYTPDGGREITKKDSLGQSIVEGWKFSWRKEEVRTGLITVMLVSFFITPFTTLLPVFARDILKVGATGQGLLLTCMGIGALCSAIVIASVGDRLPRGMLMLGSVMIYGFVLMAFAASSWYRLSLFIMVVAGFCTVHSNALVQTVVQSYSPPELRGRIMSIFYMHRVVTTAGSILVGALSALWGAPWAVASMGAVGTLSMVMIFLAVPRARHIR